MRRATRRDDVDVGPRTLASSRASQRIYGHPIHLVAHVRRCVLNSKRPTRAATNRSNGAEGKNGGGGAGRNGGSFPCDGSAIIYPDKQVVRKRLPRRDAGQSARQSIVSPFVRGRVIIGDAADETDLFRED